MRILPNTQTGLYNVNKTTAKKNISQVQSKTTKNFDELVIERRDEISNNAFVNELKGSILKDIQSSTSKKDIEELKVQIQDGSYMLGLDEVAKRMLIR